MIYGINVIYSKRITRAAIVEAEVDAMTLMSAGIPAIATGGTAFNEAKRDLILRSPIEELTLFRDNDSAGIAWESRLISELGRGLELRRASVPEAYKDVNEWRNYGEIREGYAAAERLQRLYNRIVKHF
ncbi:DNA primase [Paenibacillus sp. DS2015]